MKLVMFAAAIGAAFAAQPAPAQPLDARIKQAIIKASIRNYQGQCPCPYSSNSGGIPCFGDSAYFKPGTGLKCYDSDVSKADVDAFRRRRK